MMELSRPFGISALPYLLRFEGAGCPLVIN